MSRVVPKEPRVFRRLREHAQEWLPEDQFNQELEKVIDGVVSDLKVPQQVYWPRVIVVGRERSTMEAARHVIVIHGGWPTDELEVALLQRAGGDAWRQGLLPTAVFLVAEAWVSSNAHYRYGSRKGLRPLDDPERREAITIAGRTIDGRMNAAVAFIERDSPREPVGIGQWEVTRFDAGMGDGESRPRHLPLVSHVYEGFRLAEMGRAARLN
jgi:hypothetical protein